MFVLPAKIMYKQMRPLLSRFGIIGVLTQQAYAHYFNT